MSGLEGRKARIGAAVIEGRKESLAKLNLEAQESPTLIVKQGGWNYCSFVTTEIERNELISEFSPNRKCSSGYKASPLLSS